MLSNKNFGTILLLFTTFFWGTTFILVKQTIAIIPLDGFITIRFLFATIILLIMVITDREALISIKSRKIWIAGSLLGFLLYLSFWFQTEGLQLTTPAKAAFITGLNVILVPIFGIYPFRKKINRYEWFSGMIALIGLALLSLNFDNISDINTGDLLILVTAICVAYHVLFTDKYRELNIKTLVFVQMLVISVLSFIVSVFRGSIWLPTFTEPSIVWITIVVTSILATAFAFVSQTYAQRSGVSSTQVALIFALEPVFALIIDIITGYIPNLQAIIGMSLILISMIISSIKGSIN